MTTARDNARRLPPPFTMTSDAQMRAHFAHLPVWDDQHPDRRFPRPRPGHRWRDVPQPPGVAALPRDPVRGYPVFYTLNYPERKPGDFTTQHGRLVLACHERKLCNICGQELRGDSWFAGGPACTINGVYTEAPMHGPCLAYAAQVCPFMIYARLKPRGEHDPARDDGVLTFDNRAGQGFFFVRTSGWRGIRRKGQALLFVVNDRREVVPWQAPL